MIKWIVFFPVDSINGSSDFESGDLVSTVTRVMVSQNRLYSDSEEVVALQVFSEVIEMEGKEVNISFEFYGPITCLIVKSLLCKTWHKEQCSQVHPTCKKEVGRFIRIFWGCIHFLPFSNHDNWTVNNHKPCLLFFGESKLKSSLGSSVFELVLYNNSYLKVWVLY